MGNAVRAGLAVAAVAVAVVLFVVLSGDDDSGDDSATTTTAATTTTGTTEEPKPKPAEPEVATIVIEGGKPAGGVEELSFESGERIQFVVESDVDEEVHLHGYDVSEEVSAGGEVEFDVPATIEGVFEVELEESVVPIAEITVSPG